MMHLDEVLLQSGIVTGIAKSIYTNLHSNSSGQSGQQGNQAALLEAQMAARNQPKMKQTDSATIVPPSNLIMNNPSNGGMPVMGPGQHLDLNQANFNPDTRGLGSRGPNQGLSLSQATSYVVDRSNGLSQTSKPGISKLGGPNSAQNSLASKQIINAPHINNATSSSGPSSSDKSGPQSSDKSSNDMINHFGIKFPTTVSNPLNEENRIRWPKRLQQPYSENIRLPTMAQAKALANQNEQALRGAVVGNNNMNVNPDGDFAPEMAHYAQSSVGKISSENPSQMSLEDRSRIQMENNLRTFSLEVG